MFTQLSDPFTFSRDGRRNLTANDTPSSREATARRPSRELSLLEKLARGTVEQHFTEHS